LHQSKDIEPTFQPFDRGGHSGKATAIDRMSDWGNAKEIDDDGGYFFSSFPGQETGRFGSRIIFERELDKRRFRSLFNPISHRLYRSKCIQKTNISCNMTSRYSDAKSFKFEKDLLHKFFKRHQSSWRITVFGGWSLHSR
jgi:hypothetical protein